VSNHPRSPDLEKLGLIKMIRYTAKILLIISLIMWLPASGQPPVDDDYFLTLCKSGSALEVQAAIDSGANVNARDIDGWSPLHYAAWKNPNPYVVKALLHGGAGVIARNTMGHSPLHYAAGSNPNIDVVTVLLGAGATVNERDTEGFTPMHSAAKRNLNPNVLTMLIKAGGVVNAKAANGEMALHLAARANPNPDVITTLLAAGADPQARCHEERRPIDYARHNRHLQGTQAYWALHDSTFQSTH